MVAGSDIRHRHSPNRSAGLRVNLSQSNSCDIGVSAIGVVYSRAAVSISWKFLQMVWREENFKGAVTVIDRECGRNGRFKDQPGIRF